MKRLILIFFPIFLISSQLKAAYILIPMDNKQKNHLKSYGLTFWVLQQEVEAYWLLNHRGGSFAFQYTPKFEEECKVRNIQYEVLADAKFTKLRMDIEQPHINKEIIKLETVPRIAVYTPDKDPRGNTVQPWDDAVTLVLTYAEIPYDIIYDKEVIAGDLAKYDWLHLHHEDFTGQFGKTHRSYHNLQWYQNNVKRTRTTATELGFKKVSALKLAVAQKIKEYVIGGGFMFAMCSATDTYDIALAAAHTDICSPIYDDDPQDPKAQSKLRFDSTFAFKGFRLIPNPLEYEFSTIDRARSPIIDEAMDYFTLFDFSAKWDHIPTMLTQCHTRTIKGFMGQTTAFRKPLIKSNVLILGESKAFKEARYLHGKLGRGFWSFYGGHDPEDYRHLLNDPATDLNLHPNSPGYRLILNNVLFPAARKKKQPT